MCVVVMVPVPVPVGRRNVGVFAPCVRAQKYISELERAVLEGPDDAAAAPQGASATDAEDVGPAVAADADVVTLYRKSLQSRATMTQNALDAANKRILGASEAVGEQTERIEHLEAYVASKREDIEEVRHRGSRPPSCPWAHNPLCACVRCVRCCRSWR